MSALVNIACSAEHRSANEESPDTKDRAITQIDTLRSANGIALKAKTIIDGHDQQLVFVGWAGTNPGIIALSQDQDAQIRIYANDGTLLRSVGRRGSGPSEFESIRYLGWLADTIWVWDQRLKRLSFVEPRSGRVLRTTNLSHFRRAMLSGDTTAQPSSESARPLAVYPNNTILLAGAGLDGSAQDSGIPMYLATLNGELIRAVGRFPKNSSRMPYGGGRSGGSVLIPFSPDPLNSVSPNGDRIGVIALNKTGASFQLTIINPASDTLLSRAYTTNPERIPEERRDSAREVAISRAIERGAKGEAIRALRNMHIPEVYPAVRELLLGRDRTTWIRLRDDPTDRGRWILLDERGEILDTIYLPRTARVMEGGRNQVLVRFSDEVDVHSVLLLHFSKY